MLIYNIEIPSKLSKKEVSKLFTPFFEVICKKENIFIDEAYIEFNKQNKDDKTDTVTVIISKGNK